MRWSVTKLVAAAALGWEIVLCACAAGPEVPAPPASGSRNVILVTIDTLRVDHLSTYGYPRPTSPALDRLAARGVRFAAAFSAASCTAASHASLLTGLPASLHTIGPFNGTFPLAPGAETLAEVLAAAGWKTAAVVSNPVLARSLGLDQGFAVYDDELPEQELNRPSAEQKAGTAIAKAEAILGTLARPYFLWLHLQDPHGPYAPPPGWERFDSAEGAAATAELPVGEDQSGYGAIPLYQRLGEERRTAAYVDRYDDEIAYAMAELGRFLDHLDGAGRLADTLVVVTADHGEALGEDGFYFAHGHSVGPDQVRVPLVLAGPELAAGQVVTVPVSTAAVFNTVLAALGLPPRADDRAPSLLPLLAAGGEAPPVFVESPNQVGVAVAGAFFRRDRVPADDERFWSAPNPTTGGFWRPLGRQLMPLMPVATPPQPADLEPLLDGFERRARRAEQAMRTVRRQRDLSYQDRAALRALGYTG
jgi:arylsulfatase A-like enzyme